MTQLHKRVLLPQLPMECLDVVPPTLHLRVTHETIWIVRVREVRGQEGAWKYRPRGKKKEEGYPSLSLLYSLLFLKSSPPSDLCEGKESKVTEGKDVQSGTIL